MADAQEVKIIVHHSWESRTSVETKRVQIPTKVPKDRLVATQRDRKLKLWLDCHIGSEKIKTYEKIGHYRLSPLREFQKEENLPEQMLQMRQSKRKKAFMLIGLWMLLSPGSQYQRTGTGESSKLSKTENLKARLSFIKIM